MAPGFPRPLVACRSSPEERTSSIISWQSPLLRKQRVVRVDGPDPRRVHPCGLQNDRCKSIAFGSVRDQGKVVASLRRNSPQRVKGYPNEDGHDADDAEED